MHQEKYSLKWNAYSDHLRDMMKELMMNDDFAEVTLVSEDRKHIKAHKNILSACSPVFKDIVKLEKNTKSVIYLRGIHFSELESIMQFIYLGEATFFEERINEFLAVAKSAIIVTNNLLCKIILKDTLNQGKICTVEATFGISNHFFCFVSADVSVVLK